MFKPLDPKPNIPKLEQEVLDFWEKEKIFQKSLEQTKGGEPFVFFEGPPTANGMPGLHHIEARSFKDAILRFQTMRGRYVERRAGWDTHGLPVEVEVEKNLGIAGKKEIENLVKHDIRASIIKFNELCRKSVWKYREEWEQFTRRMGFWIDFDSAYVTYENSYIETVWWLLAELSKKQVAGKPLLFEDYKVVPFCPRCGTAISSHEVAQGYEKITETSVYVKFKVIQDKLEVKKADSSLEVVKLDKPTYLLSWTTTPWTLPGNVALAVAPDIEYAIVTNGKENSIIASQLLEKVLGDKTRLLEKCKGSDLVGLAYEPLFLVSELKTEKSHQVYPADFVTTTDGTGIVHTAVMYGEDDYELGKKFDLPKFHTVTQDGRFIESLSGLSGNYVKDKETEKRILEHLKKTKALLMTQDYTHDYPFCWRCKSPLLYYARASWFLRMSALRKELMANNEQINWVPQYIKHGRFGEWLIETKDWAISRERYWGTPLPIWRCNECKEYIVISSLDELKEKAVNFQFPISNSKTNKQQATSYKLDEVDLHRPYIDEIAIKCKSCDGEMLRVSEVLDVWFDSGAMPYAQWHYPFENKDKFQKQYPADYISEAVDQTRGWFYTLLAVATALGATVPPYKNAISLGHLLDVDGKKMSKSRGNIIEPKALTDKFGIDIVRWYMYTVNQPGDAKRFNPEDLTKLQRKLQHILWNVLNYFLTYATAHNWQSKAQSGGVSDNILDLWLNARLQELNNSVSDNLLQYNLFRAVRSIETFVDELSTWYLRRSRGRQDADFFQTLYHALGNLSILIAPFMPFFAETLYQRLKDNSTETKVSVHLQSWPESKKLTEEEQGRITTMEKARKIVEAALAFRKQERIKVRQPLADLFVQTKDQGLVSHFSLLADELNFVNVETIASAPEKQEGMVAIPQDGERPALYINKAMTPELASMGMAREIERQVQELRKQSGLQVGQDVELYYETGSGQIYEAFEYFDQNKVFVTRIIGSRNSVDFQSELFVNGEKVWIGLKQIK